jgi:hypothetical protein
MDIRISYGAKRDQKRYAHAWNPSELEPFASLGRRRGARIVLALANAVTARDSLFTASELATVLTSVDGLGYGFGTALTADGRVAMKRGNNVGFRSGLVASPFTGQGAVIMTNGNDGEAIVDNLLDALAATYGWPARAPWPE